MIYDWTDDIFAWKGWHVVKWIAGLAIAAGIIYSLVLYYTTGFNIPTEILKNFS